MVAGRGDGFNGGAVLIVDEGDGMNPIVDESDLLTLEGSAHAAAAVVTADDDVFDLEEEDGVFDDRKAIEVRLADDVGDVAVNEDFAGRKSDDLVGGNAAVGATDPEIFGNLLLGEAREKARVGLANVVGPSAVIFEEVGQRHGVGG